MDINTWFNVMAQQCGGLTAWWFTMWCINKEVV
jgi:hypothetical protein